jgi:hypothetical protein
VFAKSANIAVSCGYVQTHGTMNRKDVVIFGLVIRQHGT